MPHLDRGAPARPVRISGTCCWSIAGTVPLNAWILGGAVQPPTFADSVSPVWIHVVMPETDQSGNRTIRADWSPVRRAIDRLDVATEGSRGQLRDLGAPFAPGRRVLTAMGFQRTKGLVRPGHYRPAIRVSRVSMIALSPSLLITARHRDGVVQLEKGPIFDRDRFRETAIRTQDAFAYKPLLRKIPNDWPEERREVWAELLALRIAAATTGGLPRFLSDVRGWQQDREDRYGEAALDTESDPLEREQAARPLFDLITAFGRVEAEIHNAERDVTSRRPFVEADRELANDISLGYATAARTLHSMRGDARSSVDMVASTIASQQLQLARSEAAAAATARAKEEEQRQAQLDQRERLSRDATLLAAILLIPALVASLFGANVKLPREDTVWGTWTMLATIVASGFLAFAVLRRRGPEKDRPKGGVAVAWPFLVSLLFGVVAALIGSGTVGG